MTIEKTLNMITVLTMSPGQVMRAVYPLKKVPVVSANTPVDFENEIAPLLSELSNDAAFFAHMYSTCLCNKAELKELGVRNTDPDWVRNEQKIEMLDKARVQANQSWQSASRLLTMIQEKPQSRLRKPGT